jgi:hypothetical protein
MQPNNNTIFSLHAKDALNRLGLSRSWARPVVMNSLAIKFSLLKLAYGDSRIFPVSELRKDFYEGLKICR